jgi:hypothetical protein
VIARGSVVVISCNTADYHKLYRTVDFEYRPQFLREMKHKDRCFVALHKLLVESLKRENETYIYREKMCFVLRSDVSCVLRH